MGTMEQKQLFNEKDETYTEEASRILTRVARFLEAVIREHPEVPIRQMQIVFHEATMDACLSVFCDKMYGPRETDEEESSG
jgi:hypothetical protein